MCACSGKRCSKVVFEVAVGPEFVKQLFECYQVSRIYNIIWELVPCLDLDLDGIGETSRDITSPRIAKNLYFIFSKVVGKTLDVLWSYFAIPECANR